MRITVVVCTHSQDRYPYLREAVESVLAQTYTNHEIVIVSDGSERVAERARNEYADCEVRVHLQEPNQGLLAARNTGASLANGDVVAFLDDDAVADEDWLAELAATYHEYERKENEEILAVGGKMTPFWVAGKPEYLPEEFYWLIGVTHRGFADGSGEVRNTFGSNISMRRKVFTDLGGFDTEIGGRKGDKHLQGGETELCARLRDQHGVGVRYNPDARVAHKVFKYRTEPVWLVKRAFWQGYSKRGMEVLVPESTGEETEFLDQLLREFVPERLTGMVCAPSTAALAQFVSLFVLTGAVGVGYLYGALIWR
jgi:glycosyltransferase involved in cell wall biosynthesis